MFLIRRHSFRKQAWLAGRDLQESLELYWFWLRLGWIDILQRYQGSILGPFWLTLTSAVFIAGLGPLYARLFDLNLSSYLPYLAIGFVVWSFMSTTIVDCSNAFIQFSEILKQMRIPKLAILFQVVWRNIIVFFHSLPIFIVILALYGPAPSPVTLLVVPSFVLVLLNLIWMGLVSAIFCSRFRDIGPIISSIIQILFFLTPVMWDARKLDVSSIVVKINPFAAYLELVRAPLLGTAPDAIFVYVAVGTLVFGSVISGLLFIRARSRIVFWV